jgi:tripartite-type tricarboxylate transporter receptor subunit TctC
MKQAVTFVVCACAIAGAQAADETTPYPTRPLRLIMPNGPASSNDTLGRIVANKLGQLLGQQVVVDNRAGAGGTLGMEIGKHARPDGYTLVAVSTAAISIASHTYKQLPYQPVSDFTYVSLYGVTPNLLVVTPSLPIKNVRDLIEYAKSREGKLNMASGGPGSQSHLPGIYLQQQGKFQSVDIPYKGGGAQATAVVMGECQWVLQPAPAMVALVNAGRLRALAQSLPRRSELFPEIPSISETIPGYSYSGWNGLAVPKGMPRPVFDKIRATLVEAMASADVKEAFRIQGAEVVINTPAEFQAFVQKDIANMGNMVKAAGIKPE